MKLSTKKSDMTALLKGGAVHHILEHFPEPSSHKLAPKYQHIVDAFALTKLGAKYLNQTSTREHSFGILKDLTPTKYGDKKAIFRGSIDYVCVIDGVLHIIDWKSGKAKEQKWQSYDQLMYYAIYFFTKYPKVDEIKISYVYVEHPNMENSLVLERQYLDKYKIELLTAITNAENDEEFKKTPQRLCDWCDFQTYCRYDP